jgi:hypothetical protein
MDYIQQRKTLSSLGGNPDAHSPNGVLGNV